MTEVRQAMKPLEIQVPYENFPCKEPLGKGNETAIAHLLCETSEVVPMHKLMDICATEQKVYTYISMLRRKLTDGHQIITRDGGYQLIYEHVPTNETEVGETCDAIAIAKAKLESRVQELRSKIEAINSQLQDLNETKAALKQKLQMMDVGIMALDELEEL